MSAESPSFFNKISKKYLLLRFAETALMATAFSFLLFAVLFALNYNNEGQITASILGGIFVFILRSYKLGILKFQKATLASYLSRSYSELEESTDLLLQSDQALTLLQQIQKQRAIQKLEAMQDDIHLPHRMGLATILLMSGLLAAVLVNYFGLTINLSEQEKPSQSENSSVITKSENQPIIISKIDIVISPPAYTSTKSFHKSDMNLTLLEGTTVKWAIEFSGNTNQAQLIFSDRDTLRLKNSGNRYSTTRSFSTPGFYRIQWLDQNGHLKSTDYSKIDIVKDQAPKIRIDNLPQFTELAFEEIQNIKFNASISDDFGITNAHIIATVSKGSGESVKFREEKLEFEGPQSIHGKQILAGRTLDFHKLGMEPGDELYFYVVATDNKTPLANIARTETWFIALKDTTSDVGSFDAGMGVDLMPEYFRSQRQIIIDTEKLLAEKAKKQVTTESFKYRSNELGYDQKVLRLRYGQFLGEEFETSITPVETEEEELTNMEDVTKKFGHAHDKDNEHNLVKEKTPIKPDAHHENGDPDNPEKENPMDAIAHKHDTGEEATFFVQSVKTKLKAALTLMWDAELHLRMYEPAKSLPFQYKILKLLKEISNDSRVYVHRNGFDPPPLKEEKRLTGDLEELKNTTANYKSGNASKYPAIREALPMIESLLNADSIQINQPQREVLLRAGNELAGIAMEQPGEYLKTLSLLKSISDNAIDNDHLKLALREVMAAFWNVLPSETPTPARKNRSLHTMDRSFVKQLDSQKHE